jgi:hypothetical protein
MLRHVIRAARLVALPLIATSALACQSPTSADDTVDYDDVVDVTASPDPIIATESTDGRTYRVQRNEQPDEIRTFDWHAVFSLNVVFNQDALDDDVDLDFPIRLAATALVVKQAAGGVITPPPSGGEAERYEYAPLSGSGNMFTAVNAPVNMTLEVWYDLPSLRKEAVVTVTFSFQDDDGKTFQKSVDVRVAP